MRSFSDRWRTLLLVLALALPAHASQTKLPDLGSKARQQLTPIQQTLFRLSFLRSLYDQHAVIEDPVLNQWLTRLGQHLAQYADRHEPLTFLLIDSPHINAFAGPGGIIGIHTGLILAARSTDEVAGVIAHEIGHVQQHHLLRRLEHADRDSLTSFATLLAALLIGQQNPQAGMAAFYAGNALNLQQQLSHSRSNETEADAMGIQLLYNAGFNPDAMADFFELLYLNSNHDSRQVPEILRTHPVSQHRLAAAKDRSVTLLRQHAARGTPPPLLPLSLIQRRIRALKKTIDAPLPLQGKNWMADLGRTLQKLQARPDQAPQATRTLITRYPDTLAIRLVLAQKLSAQNPQLALQLLDIPLNDSPPPLRTLHANALADLFARNNQTARAKLNAAEANWLKGRWRQALNLLKELDPTSLRGQARIRYDTLLRKVRILAEA